MMWPDGVKNTRFVRSLDLRDAKVNCMHREQWRGFCELYKRRDGVIILGMMEHTFDWKQ